MPFKKNLIPILVASFLISCDHAIKERPHEQSGATPSSEAPSPLLGIEEQLALPPQFYNFLKLQENYRKLAEGNPLEALEHLESHSKLSTKTRSKIAAVICAEWASKDHQAAFTYLASIQGESQKARTWQEMLFNASESHLQSLLAYYQEVPNGPLQDGTASLITRKLAEHGLSASYQWATANIEQPQLSKISAELFKLALQEDLAAAISYLATITTPEHRQPVIAHLAFILSDIGLTEAFTWFETLQTSQDKETAYPVILSEYSKEHPLPAISLIAQLPEGTRKNQLMTKLAPALVKNQPSAALNWLKQLDPSLPSTKVVRRKSLGELCFHDENLAMESAILFAGDDQAYFKSLLLEMAASEPAPIAKLLKQYEGDPFHQKLISELTRNYADRSTAEMENWVESNDDPEIRIAITQEAWPLIIETDPTLSVSFIEHIPPGETRTKFIQILAQELTKREPTSEFIQNYLEEPAKIPSQLKEALSRLNSTSHIYPTPK